MTTELFGGSISADRDERAREAVRVFRGMQPGLTGFARALTGKDSLTVEIAEAGGSTDGKKIYFKPPIALGDRTPHRKSVCDMRDRDSLLLLCAACRVREEVLITIYHEIAHIAFGTFVMPTEQAKARAVEAAIAEVGTKFADKVRQLYAAVPDYKKDDYINLSSLISPFLPTIVNAIEDARVDERMFQARKGTRRMFNALTQSIFREGFETADGDRVMWSERPMNSQAIIGVFVLACRYDYKGWFHPDIEEMLGDEKLTALAHKADSLGDAHESYGLAFKILARLRELGYCLNENEPQDEEPEQEEDPEQEQDEEESDDTDDSEDTTPGDNKDEENEDEGDVPDEAEPEGDAPGGEDPDEADEEGGPGDPGSGEGAAAEPDVDEEADGASGGEGGDGPDGDGADDSDDEAEADRADEGADRDEQERAGSDRQPAGEPEAGDDDADGDGSSEDQEDAADGDAGDAGEPGGEGGDLDDDPSEAADGSQGASDGDAGQPGADDSGELTDGEGSGDRSDQGPPAGRADGTGGGSSLGDLARSDSTPGVEESGASDDAGPESQESDEHPSGDSASEDAADPDLDPDRRGEPVDTGADEGKGGEFVERTPRPKMGTAEEVERDIVVFSRHDLKGNPEPSDASASEMAAEDQAAVQQAVVQGMYFESSSVNIAGVREARFTDERRRADGTMLDAWNDRWSAYFGDRVGRNVDMHIPESILGPALLEVRRVFADNQRAKHERHLRSGKINAKVLGKRAWAGDDRLFQKKRLPGKKDYAVLLGIDISGSTIGVNIGLAKRAAMAQAELLHRAGIDFAVYAHSGDEGADGREWLDIYEIKSFDDPWGPVEQQALSELMPAAENLDGHTIEYYRKKLEKMPHTDKVILYYSDGQMPAENYAEELEILRRELITCKRQKITLLGVGIRTDSPRRHGLDTVEVHDDSDVVKVVRHLKNALLHTR